MNGQLHRVSGTYSRTAFKIEMLRAIDGEFDELAIGTAFLWQTNNGYYLVTNHHNVSGWDHLRHKALSPKGTLPTHLKLVLRWAQPQDGGFLSSQEPILLDLFDSEGRPSWLVHPRLGPTVDVIAISLGALDPRPLWPDAPADFSLNTVAINDPQHNWLPFLHAAGDDAFILGYPKGLDGGLGFPLWKRASIASEPDLDHDGLPKILVDAATRPGLSGSPVIVVRRGLIDNLNGSSAIGTASHFIGIYSGRTDDDPMGAQIGIVWKANVIEQIIGGNVRGKTPWE